MMKKTLWLLPLLLVACGANPETTPVASPSTTSSSGTATANPGPTTPVLVTPPVTPEPTTPAVPVSPLQVTPTTLALKPGTQQRLSSTQAVRWSSSNATVATIDAAGNVTALSAGQATLTATSVADAGQTAMAVVTVTLATVPTPSPKASVQTVTVTPATLTLSVGEQQALSAQVTGSGPFDTGVTWSSSNPNVLKVDAAGNVTALSAGQGIITATSVSDPTKVATAAVTVSAALPVIQSVTVTPGTLNLLAGSQSAVVARVTGTGTFDTGVKWSSSDTAVATVDASGTVSALSAGQATLTATSVADPAKAATVTVTVTAPVMVAPQNLLMRQGGSGQLSLVNAQATGWRSSDPSLVSIEADGSYTTGTRAGVATITATAADGRTYTTSLTVKDYWLTAVQHWRALDGKCTLQFGVTPNSNAEVTVRLQGDCPASVPVRVVYGDNSIFNQGNATPAQGFTFTMPPAQNSHLYVQALRNGAFGEPAAEYYWNGTFN